MNNHGNRAKKAFLDLVHTKQVMTMSRREIEQPMPVHIPSADIQILFPYPAFQYREVIGEMAEEGKLIVHESVTKIGRKIFKYEVTPRANAAVCLEYLSSKNDNLAPGYYAIREMLETVSLLEGSPSTPYFDLFLKFKNRHIDHFFTVDTFAGRIHTPVSNFPSSLRPNILIKGNNTASLDVMTMQPLLLGKILNDAIGVNQYSKWIDSGEDIYTVLQEIAGLPDRESAKKRFFEIVFSPPNDELVKLFGDSEWITWINEFKKAAFPRNPHNKEKIYSNLAWLLQNHEVQIMSKVWRKLLDADITFLTVHDEIIVMESDKRKTSEIMESVLKNEFRHFQLRGIHPQPPTKFRSNVPTSDGPSEEVLIIEPPEPPIKKILLATMTLDDSGLIIEDHYPYEQNKKEDPAGEYPGRLRVGPNDEVYFLECVF